MDLWLWRRFLNSPLLQLIKFENYLSVCVGVISFFELSKIFACQEFTTDIEYQTFYCFCPKMENSSYTNNKVLSVLSDSSSSLLNVDRSGLASKFKAYQEKESNQSKNCLGVMLKVVMENGSQPMKRFSFQGLGEFPVPIVKNDFERLKGISQFVKDSSSWEMNLTGQTVSTENEIVKHFLNKTVPLIVQLVLKKMDICSVNMKGLLVKPNKLILMEPGKSLTINPTRNTDSFGSLVVQFPVENGHEGGPIKVRRGKEWRTFSNASNSANLFQYTLFMSDCSCHVSKLTTGSMVMLTFDLHCSEPSVHFPVVSLSNEVYSILQRLSPNGPDRLLAIPLDKAEISFASLSKRTNSIVNLLSSFGFLELRVATVRRYLKGKASQPSGCECCRKRVCPCQEIVMIGQKQEILTTSKWLDQEDKPIDFDQLNINIKTEIVSEVPFFPIKPCVEKINAEKTIIEHWFDRTVLVFWHKANSLRLDCLHRFIGLLSTLEAQVRSPQLRENACSLLGQIIQLWRNDPGVAVKTNGHRLRLLLLCLQARNYQLAIQVLELLSRDEGINSEESANTLMKTIQLFGWDVCCAPVLKLISLERTRLQISHFIRFTCILLDNNQIKAAVAFSNHMCSTLTDILTSFEIPILASFIDMVMRVDEHLPANQRPHLPILASKVKQKVPSFVSLLELLTIVQDRLNTLPAERIPTTAVAWYYEVCLHLAGIIIPTETPPEKILAAVKLFASSGDAFLLDAFMSKLTDSVSQTNQTLGSLLKLEELWKQAEESADMKSAVHILVDKRIQWLTAFPKPQASWSFLNAVVIGHPLVEQFMRSDQQSMIYANFNNLQHARNWARKHFYDCHYADAQPGGIGRQAYCVITKRSQCYHGEDAKHAAYHKELMTLIDKRLKRLGDAPCSIVVDTKTEKIFAVVVQSEGIIDPNTVLTTAPVSSASAPMPTPAVAPAVLKNVTSHTPAKVQSTSQQAVLQNIPGSKKSNKRIHPAKRAVLATLKSQDNLNMANVIDAVASSGVSRVNKQTSAPSDIKPVPLLGSPQLTPKLTNLVVPGSSSLSPATTPKRPKVAKRPFSCFSPTVVQSNGVKAEVLILDQQDGSQPMTVRRDLLGASSANDASPDSKRPKIEICLA